ncbi:PREDICTED: uncharacterized protein LOC105570750 [Vollenhovia emeryi]|uniref:uncharacterized protein LOC105570750 n=1 Tax=Vollenhovia emeryi TaxID=411798 RepID=UPI0005F58C7F|nr:PREDICTED: uncharacterized protein LOC105570750 [Vollenhovia emeryi]
MADYTPTEIVDILLILGECLRNYRAAALLYAVRYPNRRHPNDTVIRNLELRAREGHLHRQRQRSVYDEDDERVLTILACVHLNPHISTRDITRATGIPQRTVCRILHSHRYHPYHITLTQALTPNDFLQRIEFCHWALAMIAQDPYFFRYVLFCDESTFKSSGELNRHNCHYWSDENPHWYRPVDNQHR